MTTLEYIGLDKIAADLAARGDALSEFASRMDKTDANTAAMRTELRSYLRGMAQMERLGALHGDVDEATACRDARCGRATQRPQCGRVDEFREARLGQRHAEKLDALDAAAAAAKLVGRCLDAARTSTRTRYLPLLRAAAPEVKPLNARWVP